jgi:malonyl CoA-acyl carrier protein transacylase
MKTYVFPGQGSQIKGMGENLFDDFADLTKKADKILGYSIKELCLNNPGQKLVQTLYTQPAMYVVNALSCMKKFQDSGETPDYLAGHSLGEYNALQAAGVFSFENGLKLVKKRGELMSKAKKGAMAAILNSSEKQIQEILEKANLTTIDLANHNAPSQIVISGLEEDIKKSQSYFEQVSAMFILLNTSGAFHSRYMKEAAAEYGTFVKRFKFSKPKIKVISNVTAKPYESINIAQCLIDQITHCVRWSDSIRFLLDQGVIEFEEIGVGNVLTKLINYIREEWTSDKKDTQDNSEQKSESVSEKSEIAKSDHLQIEILSTKEEFESKNVTTIKHDKSKRAQVMVEHWNNSYPIGTKAYSDFYKTELETRTEAMLLFGHRAAVYMKGYNGYFDLREVAPVV